MRPIFHELTGQDLDVLAENMPHALGLFGSEGSGLLTAAKYLAGQTGAMPEVIYPEKKDEIDLESGSITIDIIRRLQTMTRTKTSARRCLIIYMADAMRPDAQNAFLKLLEEPTDNVSFILLAHNSDRLLPTIISRLQRITVRPITTEQSDMLLTSLKVSDPKKRQQLLFLASGKPSRLARLAGDNELFEAETKSLLKARQFVQGSLYDKLVICQSIKSSKLEAEKLIDYSIHLIKHDIATKKSAEDQTIGQLRRLERAAGRLKSNGNPRLVLAAAVLTT